MDADRSLFEEAQRVRKERALRKRWAGKCYVCRKRPMRNGGSKCRECHAARERKTQPRREKRRTARARAARAAAAQAATVAGLTALRQKKSARAPKPPRTKPRRGENPAYDLELQG
jgi:hypothetical protein